MGLQRDARLAIKMVGGVLANRRAQQKLQGALAKQGPLPAHRFRVAVYFADGKVNMYQMRQWYKPLAKLAETWPVVVLARASGGALQMLEESPLPIAYVRKVLDLENFLAEQDIRVVFYVNQNAKNFQMMRYGRRWHVFINHGESDKMYMTTNQFKAYDYSFIAGDAARARLGKVLWDYDFDKRAIEIGRPQADNYTGTLPFTPDEREVVLYAPTWEGDRSGAAYGSISSHGLSIARGLLASPRHRLIYRPHPRAGVVDDGYGAADREIVRMIAAANAANPTAQHIYDTDPELGWQLAEADVAIVDISAMVYDRLAAGKALFITRPIDPAAEIDTGGYLSACEWLTAADAENIVARVDELSHEGEAQERLKLWAERYFGDTSHGVATARFHEAVAHLMTEWERNAAIHAADGAIVEHDEESDDEGEGPEL